jgi:hypothetical protein
MPSKIMGKLSRNTLLPLIETAYKNRLNSAERSNTMLPLPGRFPDTFVGDTSGGHSQRRLKWKQREYNFEYLIQVKM